MNYGDTLLGFWVLLNRWNPFSSHPNIPTMMDIQMRLTYVSSVNALEEAKRTPGVYYLRPPIDPYATLDFGKFDEIYKVGLKYADDLFADWKAKVNFQELQDWLRRKRMVKKRKYFIEETLSRGQLPCIYKSAFASLCIYVYKRWLEKWNYNRALFLTLFIFD